jgi:peptide/nickel transport system substrate-binding protein
MAEKTDKPEKAKKEHKAEAPATEAAPAAAPKKGGTLRIGIRVQDLSSPHTYSWIESANSARQSLDYLTHTGPDNITRPHLVEKWTASEDLKSWTFVLRKDVKWHDGQPFTSKDVKFTFDMVREAKDAPAKLRLNPRKEWYANVDAIETPDASTVVFRLKRPQPSLLTMLASGYSPVLPAHVPPAEHRSRCIGTGFQPVKSPATDGAPLAERSGIRMTARPSWRRAASSACAGWPPPSRRLSPPQTDVAVEVR